VKWLTEAEFVFRIIEVVEFCFTINDIFFLRFLLLVKRIHMHHLAESQDRIDLTFLT
jgi:hypothetical protein